MKLNLFARVARSVSHRCRYGAIFALLWFLSAPSFAVEQPFRHALIIGVAVYEDSDVPPLFGVPNDMDSAREMAQAMGIPKSQITELFNRTATRDGIAAALRKLAGRMRDGGRVFIYFSGHGSRGFVPSTGGCVEALLSWDGRQITNQQFADLVRPLGLKADQLLILIDACHSGGVIGATRSRASERQKLQPKFYLPRDAVAARCHRIANQVTRGLLNDPASDPTMPRSVTYIASARADEVSWDEPGKGGLGTQAVKRCLLGQAKDLDASGAVTWGEVEVCARQFVRQKLAGSPEFLPHHVTVRGTRNLIPMLATQSPATSPADMGQALSSAEEARRERERVERERAAAAEAQRREEERLARERAEALRISDEAASVAVIAAQQAVAVEEAVETEQAALAAPVTAIATINDIHGQRDRRVEVTLRPTAGTYKIGRDSIGLSVTSSIDGFLYLLILGSDQTSFYMLFPNGIDNQNAIKAGVALRLPRPQWTIRPAGPAGQDHLLAIVTRQPLALQDMGWTKASAVSPFAMTSASPQGRRTLVEFMTSAALRGDTYGAAMTVVEEVE